MTTEPEPFVHDPRRDAAPAVRGFDYQAHQTVLAWMNLTDDELLFIERGEDLDVERGDRVEAIQVKDLTSAPITLRSPSAVEAINNCWRHGQRNKTRAVCIRFATTASAGIERGEPFGPDVKGLHHWSDVARGADIAPLRSLLQTLSLDADLLAFVTSASDEELRDRMVNRLHWDMGQPDITGLQQAIGDQLLCDGDRQGVDAATARKALPHLITHVLTLMGSQGERRLTRPSYILERDSVWQESMPRGEAQRLRQLAAQPAMNLATAYPQVLTTPDPLLAEAVARPALVARLVAAVQHRDVLFLVGSTGFGKTTLARLVCDALGGQWGWLSVRATQPEQTSQLLRRASFEMLGKAELRGVVLDDLRLGFESPFASALAGLRFGLAAERRPIVVTSDLPPSADLLGKLHLTGASVVDVPPFDEAEVADLLDRMGMPTSRAPTVPRIVALTTRGHPQLVHARARALRAKAWEVGSEAELLMAAPDLDAVKADARRRLFNELPDNDCRQLAYRLSLVLGSFTRDVAMQLASLPSAARFPGEALDMLIGPWVETVADGRLRVSPLLEGAAKDVLQQSEVKRVDEALSLRFLRSGSITQYDVSTALMHAFRGASEQALLIWAQIIIENSDKGGTRFGDALFWFAGMQLEPGTRLFAGGAVCDFMLRLAQHRVALSSGRNEWVPPIAERLLEAVPQDTPDAELMALLAVLGDPRVPLPPDLFGASLVRFAELWAAPKGRVVPAEIAGSITGTGPLAGLVPPQAWLHLAATHAQTPLAMARLFTRMDRAAAPGRALLLETFAKDPHLASSLVGASWYRDEPAIRADPMAADEQLDQMARLGRSWGLPRLVAASYVARSVLADELADQPDRATLLVDEAVRELGASGELLYQQMKIRYRRKQYADASTLAPRIVAVEADLPEVERVFFNRMAGVTFARLDYWAAAQRYFSSAAAHAAALQTLKPMEIGLRADAALACWRNGHLEESLAMFGDVLDQLQASDPDDTVPYRWVRASAMHCMFWINAKLNGSVLRTMNEPPAGVCSDPERGEAAEQLAPKSLPAAWALLATIEAIAGEGNDIMARARASVPSGHFPVILESNLRLSQMKRAMRTGDGSDIVLLTQRQLAATAFLKTQEALGMDWNCAPVPERIMDGWTLSGSTTFLLTAMLAVAIRLTVENQAAPLPIAQWQGHLSLESENVPLFGTFLEALDGGNAQVPSPNTQVEFFQGAAVALSALRQSALPPAADLARMSFRLLNPFSDSRWADAAAEPVAALMGRTWARVCRDQAFAFRTPAVTCGGILALIDDPAISGFRKAGAIVEAALDGLGVSVSAEARQMLRTMESAAHESTARQSENSSP